MSESQMSRSSPESASTAGGKMISQKDLEMIFGQPVSVADAQAFFGVEGVVSDASSARQERQDRRQFSLVGDMPVLMRGAPAIGALGDLIGSVDSGIKST
mmetsp:Transcript_23569/g.32176  ORF Transcript_23569/g.32176 Transcript_23569/m.32176 type:complete len:100 (-) Transcript_23569:227-526(-)